MEKNGNYGRGRELWEQYGIVRATELWVDEELWERTEIVGVICNCVREWRIMWEKGKL